MQITSIQEAKEKQEVELEYKSYVNVFVCVRACVCSYVCQNDILHMYVCLCRCACVRVCAEKSLAHLTLRKLRDPARIATKDDCFHRSWPPGRSVAQAQSSKSPLTMRCPGPNQVEEQPWQTVTELEDFFANPKPKKRHNLDLERSAESWLKW